MFCLLVAYDVTLSNLFIWLFIFSYKNFISTKAEIKALTENEQQGANGQGIRRVNLITLLRVISTKIEKPGS